MGHSMRIVSDISYGRIVGAVDPAPGARGGIPSSLRLFRASKDADVIFTNEGKCTRPGLIVLAFLLWVTRQRKLVLSEFLPGHLTGLNGWIVTRAYRMLLPRVLLAAQVMTAWELEDYIELYGIPRDRLRLIPFYSFDDRLEPEPAEFDARERHGYLSTGKNSCDWATLIAAADGQGWPLTIVCRGSERDRFEESAAAAGVTIKSDIPRADHDQLLGSSELLIMALEDRAVSAGHVRLMTAATHGVPVIASDIRGIAGYEELAVAIVPQHDPEALRASVRELMADRERLAREVERVRAYARRRPYSLYEREIAALVGESVAQAA